MNIESQGGRRSWLGVVSVAAVVHTNDHGSSWLFFVDYAPIANAEAPLVGTAPQLLDVPCFAPAKP